MSGLEREPRGTLEKLTDLSKKANIVTGIIGVIAGSSGLVAVSIVSYLAGDYVEDTLKRRRHKNYA